MSKPIEKAFITYHGDSSVGIPSANFEATMFYDPNFDGAGMDYDLEDIRTAFRNLYLVITGENCSVQFDFEYEARCKMESEE